MPCRRINAQQRRRGAWSRKTLLRQAHHLWRRRFGPGQLAVKPVCKCRQKCCDGNRRCKIDRRNPGKGKRCNAAHLDKTAKGHIVTGVPLRISGFRLTGIVGRHLGAIDGLDHFGLRHRGGIGRPLHKQAEKAAYYSESLEDRHRCSLSVEGADCNRFQGNGLPVS